MSETQTMSVLDILRQVDAATARMSKSNPHRIVLLQCGAAIIELAQRANGLEAQHLATPAQVETIGYVEPTEATA